MDYPYIEILKKVRRFLESGIELFPATKCQDSARFLKLLLGLEEVGGYFDPKKTANGLIGISHVWSLDSEKGLYIDLTMDQFGDYSEVSILPLNTNLLLKDEGLDKYCSIRTSAINPNLEELLCEFRKSNSVVPICEAI